MGKYDPLCHFLENAASGVSEITLSFSQIEQILGDVLPDTAKYQRMWWANEIRSGTQPQSSSWLNAGWEVDEVEREQKWVRFRRAP